MAYGLMDPRVIEDLCKIARDELRIGLQSASSSGYTWKIGDAVHHYFNTFFREKFEFIYDSLDVNFSGVSITTTPVEQIFSSTEHQTHKNATPSTTNALITVSAGVRGNQVRTMNKRRDDEARALRLNNSDVEAADNNLLNHIDGESEEKKCKKKKKRPLRSIKSHLEYTEHIDHSVANATQHNESHGNKTKAALQGR